MITKFTTLAGKEREMTCKESLWLSHYLCCSNASEASRLCGITDSVRQHGSGMKRKLINVIQSNLRNMIGSCAPDALETVYDLAKNCQDSKVRLTAAQDLLNRAGYKETKRIEVSIADKSSSDIDKEIEALLKKGGIVQGSVVIDAEIIGE